VSACGRLPRIVVAAIASLALTLAPNAAADPTTDPVTEGLREQSCRSLAASTVGFPDQAPAEGGAGGDLAWPAAAPGLLPGRVHLRTATESFNRRYAFATRAGQVYVQRRVGSDATWRQMPLPLCFAGRVRSLSVDDDELIALDGARRIFTMDNALKDAALFNWTSRWGTPFWAGPGYQLPGGVVAWSWSVVSPLEDGTWTDPAGNETAIGGGKVSHIWGLRSGGRRLTFWDPWLALDESYEMCAPHRGRFRAVNLSASGSTIFVIGRRGDMFTRLYDFDLSGHDEFFFEYSYEDQRGKGDGAPIQLPAARWVRRPKIPGRITSTISIHKVGKATVHRTMRVEGLDVRGRTGYWEKDVTQRQARAWRFHPTGRPLRAPLLENPGGDTSRRGLARAEDIRFARRAPGLSAELRNYNVYCSPARLRIRPPAGGAFDLDLHNVDGLRQQPRARGLDNVPREQYGNIEVPRRHLKRPFVRDVLGGRRFTNVTLEVTSRELRIEELGWSFARKRSR
jgi:hypothetical protein